MFIAIFFYFPFILRLLLFLLNKRSCIFDFCHFDCGMSFSIFIRAIEKSFMVNKLFSPIVTKNTFIVSPSKWENLFFIFNSHLKFTINFLRFSFFLNLGVLKFPLNHFEGLFNCSSSYFFNQKRNSSLIKIDLCHKQKPTQHL